MNSKKMIIGLGGKDHKEDDMICMEVQKLYGMAGELEVIAGFSQNEAEKAKLIAIADRLTTIADSINVEMDCMED